MAKEPKTDKSLKRVSTKTNFIDLKGKNPSKYFIKYSRHFEIVCVECSTAFSLPFVVK